ncbi:MAG: bifunctional 3-deoxy-7-phosphoheptulonate synthase/chorismate mutase, partial [Myxococcaceae bacterium]|nr:bifunctional 3-deoxy-7-phosphoheptulonate synthase/chorismate mutase [Myxococcaceae bacterium]
MGLGAPQLDELRSEIDALNDRLLRLLNERAVVAGKIRDQKRARGLPVYDPERELKMIAGLVQKSAGPFPPSTIAHLFNEIVRATVGFMEGHGGGRLQVAREAGAADRSLRVGPHVLGLEPALIAGPCSVESEAMIFRTARHLASRGVRFLRGGAWKPRTSPYDFQGLGHEGLDLLCAAAREHGLASITEVVDPRHVAEVAAKADMLQVGARNMQNFELLKEVGRSSKPVLLKRGLASTLDELLGAAEYVLSHGNPNVALCERGVRTFERLTRNTFDASAVALLRRMTALPVLADVSHAAGRRDILPQLARAALAAGAQGVMLEVHPCPAVAR